MAPVVGAPTTVFATTEASPVSNPISVPVSSSIHAVPKQLGSSPGPETTPTVNNHAALMIVVTNYWSFSICLQLALVHYRPLHLVPSCKQPQN